MTDEELHNMVRHLAELHGVSPAEVVAEVTGGEAEDDEDLEQAEEAEEAAPLKRRGRAHWTAWSAAMVVTGAMVGLVIVGLMKFVNDPASAAMAPRLSPPAASPSGGPATGTSLLASQIVNFSYPAIFDQVAELKNDAVALEQYNLSSKADYHRLITMEVRPLESGDVNDDASYKIRHNDRTEYHEAAEKVGADVVVLMTKTDGHEQTMFWVHQAKLLTVSATSTDPVDSVTKIMAVVKASVRWNK